VLLEGILLGNEAFLDLVRLMYRIGFCTFLVLVQRTPHQVKVVYMMYNNRNLLSFVRQNYFQPEVSRSYDSDQSPLHMHSYQLRM